MKNVYVCMYAGLCGSSIYIVSWLRYLVLRREKHGGIQKNQLIYSTKFGFRVSIYRRSSEYVEHDVRRFVLTAPSRHHIIRHQAAPDEEDGGNSSLVVRHTRLCNIRYIK